MLVLCGQEVGWDIVFEVFGRGGWLLFSRCKMDYFMWIDWDVPRRMEAKLAVGPLDIDSIVLLLSSSLFIHHCFGVFV